MKQKKFFFEGETPTIILALRIIEQLFQANGNVSKMCLCINNKGCFFGQCFYCYDRKMFYDYVGFYQNVMLYLIIITRLIRQYHQTIVDGSR